MRTVYTRTLSIALFFLLLIATTQNSNATKHIINTSNFVFTPSTLNVNLGDTLVWQWINGTHTTTSTTIPPGATPWAANLKVSLQTFTYVPAVLGTYNYKCTPHEITKGMIASFTVVCASPTVTISAGGPTSFCKGGSVTLSSTTAFPAYQWEKDGGSIVGATNSTFNATETGSYTLDASNSCGATGTSNAIGVTSNPKPKAKATPVGPIDICAGQTVQLSVTTGANLVFQWKNGNANIPGATNSTVIVGAAGVYKCKVTNSVTGCTKTSNGITVNVTCKSTQHDTELTVFPNPTTDYFVLNSAAFKSQVERISVYDLTGKLREQYLLNQESINIGESLPPGIYFGRLEMNGEIKQVIKLIKN